MSSSLVCARERVVVNGAFKIDSALQIKAQPSMMSAVEGEGETRWTQSHQKERCWGTFYAYLTVQRLEFR